MIKSQLTHGHCPRCLHKFEFATSLENRSLEPKVGDISFCIGCGAINEFSESGIIPTDLSKLDPELRKELSRIKQAWVKLKKRK